MPDAGQVELEKVGQEVVGERVQPRQGRDLAQVDDQQDQGREEGQDGADGGQVDQVLRLLEQNRVEKLRQVLLHAEVRLPDVDALDGGRDGGRDGWQNFLPFVLFDLDEDKDVDDDGSRESDLQRTVLLDRFVLIR